MSGGAMPSSLVRSLRVRRAKLWSLTSSRIQHVSSSFLL